MKKLNSLINAITTKLYDCKNDLQSWANLFMQFTEITSDNIIRFSEETIGLSVLPFSPIEYPHEADRGDKLRFLMNMQFMRYAPAYSRKM